MTAIVTEEVKSIGFDGLAKVVEAESASAPTFKSDPFMVEGNGDVPDLLTLEEQKKAVQRHVHEKESFWSYFCFRGTTDCCAYPCHCHCGSDPIDGCACCCLCGDSDCSACCNDCSGCCNDCCNDCSGLADCCLGCGACCAECAAADGCNACFSSC